MSIQLALFLAAVAEVESGTAAHPRGDDLAIGKAGEVSRYQMSRALWAKYSSQIGQPRADWKDPTMAARIAEAHSLRILAAMPADLKGSEQRTVFWAAVAWNRGLSVCVRDGWAQGPTPSKAVFDYAWRVVNVYLELKKGVKP